MNIAQMFLFAICLIIFINEQEINAADELYSQSSGRIRSSFVPRNTILKGSKSSQFYGMSPTFIQSRRFHSDYRQPSIPSSRYHTYDGLGSNQEGCRLTNNYCSGDQQCCSGKCRCVRWSVMGRMSCYKKCF